MLPSAQLSIRTPASTGKVWATLSVYLFLVGATIVLLYPVIFTREGSFCIKQDNLHQPAPSFQTVSTSLHKGYLPVWDANTYGGKNFAGEIQPGIFYPVNILWCLLFGSAQGIDVYYIDLLTVLHFLLCLLGLYNLARVFQLPRLAAIAAALVFTFTGPVAARAGGQTGIFFGLCWIPWSLYFTARYYLVQKRRVFFVCSGLIAGMEILAGHIQPFFHTLLINGVMILFYEYKVHKGWKTLLTGCCINGCILLLAAIIIALPQLYYSAQYLSHCYRSVGEGQLTSPGQQVPLSIYASRFIIQLSNLPNLLGQDITPPEDDNIIYMGILPLCLFVTYLLYRKSLQLIPTHRDLTSLLWIILLIGGVCAIGYLTFIPLLLHELPVIPAVRQLGRYIILVSLATSLFTGLAMGYIGEIKQRLERHRLLSHVLIVLTVNLLYLLFVAREAVPATIIIPLMGAALFFLALLNTQRMTDLMILALAIICIDVWCNSPSYSSTRTPFYANRFYGRNRIIDSLEKSYGKYRVAFDMANYALERRNLGDVYNIQTNWGYGATYNTAYYDFIHINPRPASEIVDLQNVRFVVTDKTLDSGFVFKDSVGALRLYEKKNYYPRIYWKHQLGMRGEDIERINVAGIRQTAYSDLYQRIEVDCLQPDTLILSENYYPGWTCLDNGGEITIRPAVIKHYPPLFRSVILDKGQHLLEFKYKKPFIWF